ncbi:hypothetical protein [Frigoriglobus tundricola]|uniref:hypothetical protein n=1 Tax=Frigoriglobus tundricola TaxID=2774151 RepID=UPI00148E9605|nr:hypothetical protein [Frigoriglobus tundricola]
MQLADILREHAAGGTCVLVALAEGGDQAFTDAALALGIPVDVVLPCTLYEDTFEGAEAKAKYHSLLAQSNNVVTLDYVEPSEDAFLAAGKYVVDHCDLLVTLWNGKQAAGKGGTGDVVEYARSLGRPLIHVHPGLLEVTGPG